jgi:hypothetical protein
MIFSPNLSWVIKVYSRNISCMAAVNFFACLDLERESSFYKGLKEQVYFYHPVTVPGVVFAI